MNLAAQNIEDFNESGFEIERTNSPLKIAIVASTARKNASTSYLVHLGISLMKRGHSVKYFVERNSHLEQIFSKLSNANVSNINFRKASAVNLFKNYSNFSKEMRNFQPDIINVFQGCDHSMGAFYALRNKVPIIRTRCTSKEVCEKFRFKYLYNRLSDGHILSSDYMLYRDFVRKGLNTTGVEVIRTPFDIEAFRQNTPSQSEAKSYFNIPENSKVLGCIGKLAKRKGLLELIDAFSSSTHKDSILLISGLEDDLSALDIKKKISELGIDNRVIVSNTIIDDVRIPLLASDVIAIPSLSSESISTLAIEALSLGIPLIASRIHCLPETIGDAGILVKPGNKQELVKAIDYSLGNDLFRKKSSEKGPQRIKARHSPKKFLLKTEELMRRAILEKST